MDNLVNLPTDIRNILNKEDISDQEEQKLSDREKYIANMSYEDRKKFLEDVQKPMDLRLYEQKLDTDRKILELKEASLKQTEKIEKLIEELQKMRTKEPEKKGDSSSEQIEELIAIIPKIQEDIPETSKTKVDIERSKTENEEVKIIKDSYYEEDELDSDEETENKNTKRIIFKREKYNKIKKEDTLKMKKEELFGKSFEGKKEKIQYIYLLDTEMPIDIKYCINGEENKILLPLYNQMLFERDISKIPKKKRKYIKNIHFICIEIIIKAHFIAGIDTPIEITLSDERIVYPKEATVIAKLKGNLIYQTVKFRAFINYSIGVEENKDQAIGMICKLPNFQMIEGSMVFSICMRKAYMLSNKCEVDDLKKFEDNVVIEPLFKELIQKEEYQNRKENRPKIQQKREYEEVEGVLCPKEEGESSKIIPKVKLEDTYEQYHIIGRIGDR